MSNDGGDTPTGCWKISNVSVSEAGRGRRYPKIESIAFRAPGGENIGVGKIGPWSAVDVEILARAEPTRFDRCPICLAPGPSSEEHVPPRSIGGSVMTWTCETCNNKFGSTLEASLKNWHEDATTNVGFSHEAVRGVRRASWMLMMRTQSNEPVFVLDGKIDPIMLQNIQQGGKFSVTFSSPDPWRIELAALKSAYLGACTLVKHIPETPEARLIRDELMAARSLPKGKVPQKSAACSRLHFTKLQGPAIPGEVMLVRILGARDGRPEFAVSLARTLLVSWPIGGNLAWKEKDGNVVRVRRLAN